MDQDELLERYEALGADDDFLAARPLFEAEIRRREQSEQGLHGHGWPRRPRHGVTSSTTPPSAAGS